MSRPNFNDMDWQSVLDSEIFRNYMKSELQKEADLNYEKSSPEYLEKQSQEELKIYEQLNDFRAKVASSTKLKEYFKQCRKILATNKELAKKVDPKFIQGIKLLSLGMDDSDDSDISLSGELSDKEAINLHANFEDFVKEKYDADISELTSNMLEAFLKDFCEEEGINQDTQKKLLTFIKSKNL